MNPSQLRVRDPIKKKRRKEQAERAFKAYQQRQTRMQPDIDQPATIHHQPAYTQVRGGDHTLTSLSTSQRKSDPPYSKSTPNVLTVPPLSEVATPADSIAETQTPQYDSNFAIPLDISKYIAEPSATPGQAQSPAQTIILDGGRKRPAPLEFDLAIPTSSRRQSSFRSNPSIGPEETWARSNEASAWEINTSTAQDLGAGGTHHVDESKSIVKDRSTAIAELEDKMSVPRGFIDFIKNGLTITRASVASALSSSASLRSRWSRKESRQIQPDLPQTSPEPGRDYFSQHAASQDQPEHQWTQIAPPATTGGRANTHLSWELQLAGATDEEIARRLEALINDGANPNARSADGETPLHVALRLGNHPACQVLLDNGADVHVKTLNGKSLSQYGRIAQDQAGDNVSRYLAIKTCRYAIREHDPHRKAAKASKLATNVIVPPAVHEDDGHEPGGQRSGSSLMDVPHESVLGELEVRQPPPAHEPGSLSHGEGPTGAMPSNDSPFPNINYHGWNMHVQTTNASNSEGHYSAINGFEPDLQSIYDMPPISYLDQTPARPPGRGSPVVQKLVEYFDGRQSTKSSSASVCLQSNILDGWHNQDPSLAHSHSSVPNLNEGIFYSPNMRSSGFEKTSKHRRAARTLNGQWNLPVDPRQTSQSSRHGFGLPSESVLDSASPTRLSGYLTTLPTGQMALVCPLSENDSLQYIMQDSDTCSPAVVKITSTSGLAPPTMAPHAYATETGDSSALEAPRGQTLQTAIMIAAPAWADVAPPVQSHPAPLRSDFMNCNAIGTPSTSIAGGEYALNYGYVDGWDFSRTGFNS
jgi:hypothetical protein